MIPGCVYLSVNMNVAPSARKKTTASIPVTITALINWNAVKARKPITAAPIPSKNGWTAAICTTNSKNSVINLNVGLRLYGF